VVTAAQPTPASGSAQARRPPPPGVAERARARPGRGPVGPLVPAQLGPQPPGAGLVPHRAEPAAEAPGLVPRGRRPRRRPQVVGREPPERARQRQRPGSGRDEVGRREAARERRGRLPGVQSGERGERPRRRAAERPLDAQRPQHQVPERVLEGRAGHALHGHPQQAVGGAAVPHLAPHREPRRGAERELRGRRPRGRGGRGPRDAVQAAGVGEELAQRHARAGGGRVGHVARPRGVDRQRVGVDEPQHRQRRPQLGDRGDRDQGAARSGVPSPAVP
jgi:hypothetical protein